ncbi:Hsp20/alpha crystallin family protein [Paenibacillus chartarius]|uniref:Hsp20/alpha crystallin family protein n=1 Tax=Paenibacillus chartarius TaxID=747481 RepID=A0ABV6DSZ9_9BACL
MDFDKLRQWFEMAQKYQGKTFWSGVFDQEYAKQFMNEFNEAGQGNVQTLYPKADIFRNPQEFIILIDIPGVRKEDVQLSLAGDSLYVRGTSRPFYSDMQLIASERFSGTFERAIRLPESVGGAKISAKFENGLLEIHIVRKLEAQVEIPID